MPSLRFIKVIVIGMTLLLLILTGVVIWAMLNPDVLASSGRGAVNTTSSPKLVVGDRCPSSDEIDLPWVFRVFSGKLLSTHYAGGSIAALIEQEDGSRISLLINPCTGTLIGTIGATTE